VSRSWQVFAVEVALFGGAVGEGLVGADGFVWRIEEVDVICRDGVLGTIY
jgi:hypothetical protein